MTASQFKPSNLRKWTFRNFFQPVDQYPLLCNTLSFVRESRAETEGKSCLVGANVLVIIEHSEDFRGSAVPIRI